MPLQETSGAASYDAFGGGVPVVPTYIEDVFSTWLYTGNGSTQTITNGVDLAGKGGMVWTKGRSAAQPNSVFDTVRGATNQLVTNSTAANNVAGTSLTAFNSNGFSLAQYGDVNSNGTTMVAWAFREQAKFFDVVTYTGNGNNRTIAHSLGSTPGCIIIKCTSAASPWPVYHRGLTDASTSYVSLNTTASRNVAATYWNSTAPTSTVFSLGTSNDVNQSGQTYVAYLFAHNAGGFGLTGTDNVITCGNFTTDGSGYANIDLGYEPQWVLAKRTSTNDSWLLVDNMRAFVYGPAVNTSDDARLVPNSDSAENINDFGRPTATGFEFNVGTTNSPYIYIAIRRGPMKTPTSGTSVFKAMYGTGGTPSFTTTFPVDLMMDGEVASTWNGYTGSRLQGGNLMYTNSTAAETSSFAANITYDYSYGWGTSAFDSSHFSYMWGRAPGFMDVVCYTGTGSAGVVLNHNLTVVPELIITKVRNYTGEDWIAHYNNGSSIIGGYLNSTSAFANSSTAPSTDLSSFTSTTYTLNTSNRRVNGAYNYVAYLFASCPGVSKVGSYTGSGATKQIDCGFAAGARWVMIKRTDSTGDWYVWDSTRGIVAGNDPYLLLNSNAAQVTNTDYVDTYNAGFEISSTAPAAINANGGTFIFLAIA